MVKTNEKLPIPSIEYSRNVLFIYWVQWNIKLPYGVTSVFITVPIMDTPINKLNNN